MEPKLKLEKAVSSSTSSRYHVASGTSRTRVAKWTTRNERWVPRCNRLEGGSLQRCCPPRGSCGHGTRVMMTRWERSDSSYLSRGYISDVATVVLSRYEARATPERRAQSGWWEWFDGLARTLSAFPRRGTLGAGGDARVVGGFGGDDRLKDGRAWSDMMNGMDGGGDMAQRTL